MDTNTALNLELHEETVRRLNTTLLMAARDAARANLAFARAAYGLTPAFARWLRKAPPDEVVNLAQLPTCMFQLRLPERVAERVCRPATSDGPDADPHLLAVHAALNAVRGVA